MVAVSVAASWALHHCDSANLSCSPLMVGPCGLSSEACFELNSMFTYFAVRLRAQEGWHVREEVRVPRLSAHCRRVAVHIYDKHKLFSQGVLHRKRSFGFIETRTAHEFCGYSRVHDVRDLISLQCFSGSVNVPRWGI